MNAIVTVVGQDKVGIIAAVCALLAENNVNILDISQTILQGSFTMVMAVDVQKAKGTIGDLRELLEELGRKMAQASGYTLANVPYASSFAGYKDWFIQRFRRPGYTIEVGEGVNPLPLDQFDEIYRDNLPILLIGATG